jgi:hypothetical protein
MQRLVSYLNYWSCLAIFTFLTKHVLLLLLLLLLLFYTSVECYHRHGLSGYRD